MTTLIAEDLVLLLLDDESGKFTNASYLDTGIGGALLVELALNQTVEVVKGSGLWARAKVRPTGLSAPADPVLAEALALVGEKERTADDLVEPAGQAAARPAAGPAPGARHRRASRGSCARVDLEDTMAGRRQHPRGRRTTRAR